MLIPRDNNPEQPTQAGTLAARMAASAPSGASAPVEKKKEPKVKGPESAKWLLTRKQKLFLVRLAKDAWIKSGAAKTDESEEAFRQREAMDSIGRRISEATQGDWNALVATFKRLAGDIDGAFTAAMNEGSSDRNVALFKIREEMKKHGLTEAYGLAILKTKYKVTGWAWATAKQIWGVMFDIRRSHTAAARLRRETAAKERETVAQIVERRLAEAAAAPPPDYDEPF